MLIQAKKQDAFAARRVTDAFPRDAGRTLRFLFLLALPPIILTRYKLGERVVGVPRILLTDLLLCLYVVVVSVWFGDGVSERIAELLVWGTVWILLFTVFALGQRITRWVKRQRGERLTTWCMGLSYLGLRIPNGNAERYLEPLIFVGGGIYLHSAGDVPLQVLVAPWLIVSGLALLVTENYVHSLHLDRFDALLEADKHGALTEDHLRATGLAGPAQVTPSTPIATGMDKDLAATVKRRDNQRASEISDAPSSGATLPTNPNAPIAVEGSLQERPAERGTATATPPQGPPSRPSILDALPPKVRENLIPLAIGGVMVLSMVVSDLRSSKLFTAWRADPDASAREAAAALIERAKQPLAPRVPPAPLYPTTPQPAPQQPVAAPAVAPPAAALTPDSLFLLAQRYETGDDRPKDLAKAMEFYGYAAEQGSAFALFRLGVAYEKGEGGLPQDDRKAAENFNKAADKGHKTAKVFLADKYRLGKGVTKHALTAVSLYEEVADDPRAMAGIAYIIYEGDGPVEANPVTAVSLWKRAAEMGHAGSQRAIDSLKELARAGDHKVQTNLTLNGIAF